MGNIHDTTDEQIEQMREVIRREKARRASAARHRWWAKAQHLRPWAGTAVFLICVAFLVYTLTSVLMTKNRGEIPSLFGYQLYVVESGSMSPTLKVGAIIISKKPADPASLRVGDVVTYRMLDGSVVTHRVIEALRGADGSVSYRTKGDNPVNSPDAELLTPDRIIAKMVARVPFT